MASEIRERCEDDVESAREFENAESHIIYEDM